MRATSTFAPAGPADYGAWFTPPATADFMVSLLAPAHGDRVLDPCAGDGSFVAALLRAGLAPSQITAWELDPGACERLRIAFPGVTVECRDSLLDTELESDRRPRFDRVIANPPYLNKASAYVRAHRRELRERYAALTGAGETCAMFLHLGLDLLARDGRLVFIVSDTLRTLRTHERLRARVLREHGLAAVAATPAGLFPGASVRTAILAIDREPRRSGRIRALPVAPEDGAYAHGPWTVLSRRALETVDGSPFCLEAPESIVRLFRQPRRLRDRVRGHIGMHTRENRRFLAALESSHLARRFDMRRAAPDEYPVISAEEAASERWRPYLKEGGEKDFHFPIVEYVDWSPEARARYVIPAGGEFGRPGLCVSGVSRRLSARVMLPGCLWDTNKVIGLVPVDRRDTLVLLGLLNSDLYTFIAKRLLNESSSLQLSDLWSLPLPKLRRAESRRIAVCARECFERLRLDLDADVDAPRRAFNRAVYDALRIEEVDREAVRAFLARGRLRGWS